MLNAPVALVESLAGVEHGAWELEIEVPAEPRWSVREPLLTTGVWRTRSDVVFIEYGEEGRARLGYFHVGWGAVRSAELAVTPGATYRLKIMHPGLTPPPSHGMFAVGGADAAWGAAAGVAGVGRRDGGRGGDDRSSSATGRCLVGGDAVAGGYDRAKV